MGERSKILNLRYSEQERTLWRAGAAAAGMNLTEWIRHLIGRELTEEAAGGRPEPVGDNVGEEEGGGSSSPSGPEPAASSANDRLAGMPAAKTFRPDFKKTKQ